MSIVGTRPPLISETNLYELHHKARLAIKPGITGMWQVSGRSDITDFEEVVRLAVGGTVGSVITNKYRDIKDKKELKTLGTYSVKKDAEIKKIKLVLKTGDQIAILAADDDSILIVKNGDKDNPYFVSADFLKGCSDYKGK